MIGESNILFHQIGIDRTGYYPSRQEIMLLPSYSSTQRGLEGLSIDPLMIRLNRMKPPHIVYSTMILIDRY